MTLPKHSFTREQLHRDMVEVDTIGAVLAMLGAAVATPIPGADGVANYVVPDGFRVERIDDELDLGQPRRARGLVRPGTVQALTDYLDRYAQPSCLSVWVSQTGGRITAVLNDHYSRVGSGEDVCGIYAPGHRDLLAELTLRTSPEWDHWMSRNGESMSQVDFAEHIEANGKEIRTPTAAEMLEIAQSFHASSSATFRSTKRLQDGTTQMRYDEETTATAGKSGDMTVPSEIELALRPYLGETAYKVVARLRYRVSGGRLSLSYHLDRPTEILNDAVEQIAQRLGERYPHVYIGSPS